MDIVSLPELVEPYKNGFLIVQCTLIKNDYLLYLYVIYFNRLMFIINKRPKKNGVSSNHYKTVILYFLHCRMIDLQLLLILYLWFSRVVTCSYI